MLEKFKKKEIQIWGVLSFVVLMAWAITVGMFYENYKMKEHTFLETELSRFEGEVESTLITYEEFANYIFDELTRDEEILSIMAAANSASNAEKKVLRDRLHIKVAEQYPAMKKYRFRQFHFHLPTTESFLRVHLPERYGDLLINNRESVRLVNETQTEISGFEEGKIFNGFRNVYPLEYKGEHVGSVEISMSSASIIEILSELQKKRDYYFVIDKEVVEDNLFADQLENYRNSEIIPDYYVDIEVDKFTSMNNAVTNDFKELFFQSIDEASMEKVANKESFTMVHTFEGKDYLVNFLGIKNFKNTPSAYLLSVSYCAGGYKAFMQDMYWEVILVSFLAFFIIAFGLVLAFYQNNLKDSAELDYLTNIYNRNKFYEIAKREVKIAKRNNQELAIMFLDIDHFKVINDTYGHAWGDKVLQALAKQILLTIREVDVLARWGGEEFVLLLPNTDKEGAFILGEKIRKMIEESASEELQDITVSIGVCPVNPKTFNVEEAIGHADLAMYEAKRRGRNQVCCK